MKEQFLRYGKGKLSVLQGQDTTIHGGWLEENPFGIRSDWEHVLDRGALCIGWCSWNQTMCSKDPDWVCPSENGLISEASLQRLEFEATRRHPPITAVSAPPPGCEARKYLLWKCSENGITLGLRRIIQIILLEPLGCHYQWGYFRWNEG